MNMEFIYPSGRMLVEFYVLRRLYHFLVSFGWWYNSRFNDVFSNKAAPTVLDFFFFFFVRVIGVQQYQTILGKKNPIVAIRNPQTNSSVWKPKTQKM